MTHRHLADVELPKNSLSGTHCSNLVMPTPYKGSSANGVRLYRKSMEARFGRPQKRVLADEMEGNVTSPRSLEVMFQLLACRKLRKKCQNAT